MKKTIIVKHVKYGCYYEIKRSREW